MGKIRVLHYWLCTNFGNKTETCDRLLLSWLNRSATNMLVWIVLLLIKKRGMVACGLQLISPSRDAWSVYRERGK
jgi:hypothetical protein